MGEHSYELLDCIPIQPLHEAVLHDWDACGLDIAGQNIFATFTLSLRSHHTSPFIVHPPQDRLHDDQFPVFHA